jgi:DNA-binding beta-propeller fold protein YncE
MRTVLLAAALLASAFSAHAGPVWYALAFKAPDVAPTSVFGTIDPATGVVTPIGVTPATLGHDIAVSPGGQVYGTFGDSSESLYSIDKLTGATTLIGAFGADIHTLAFRSDGALFGASTTDLYKINPATGAATLVGATGMGTDTDNIRFDPLGILYVMSAESDSRLFTLNQTTGAATLIGSSGTDDISLGGFLGGAFLGTNADPGGEARLVSVNPLTGAATLGATTDNTIYVIALDPTSVPEPGTIVLLSLPLGILLIRRRTQRL